MCEQDILSGQGGFFKSITYIYSLNTYVCQKIKLSKIEVNFHLNIIICSVLSDKIEIVRIFRKNLLQKSGNHTEF